MSAEWRGIMMASAVARRYARALFSAAAERQADARVGDELRAVVELIRANPRFARLLMGPELAERAKRILIRDVLGTRAHPLVVELLELLLEKKRLDGLTGVAHEYRAMLEERHGVQRAEVVTARPIPAHLVARLIGALGVQCGRKIELEQRVDARILGGAIVRLGDRVIDGSVRRRLDEMRALLLNAEVQPRAE